MHELAAIELDLVVAAAAAATAGAAREVSGLAVQSLQFLFAIAQIRSDPLCAAGVPSTVHSVRCSAVLRAADRAAGHGAHSGLQIVCRLSERGAFFCGSAVTAVSGAI